MAAFLGGATLAQTSSLEGDVIGPNGAPLGGALIRIDRVDLTGHYRVMTGRNGHFIYSGLPLGTYNLTCNVDGQDVDSEKDIHTQVGAPVSVNFDLRATGKKKIQQDKDTVLPPAPPPVVQLRLPATYLSAKSPSDQIQLNADSSFSLQEAGQTYHGTFTVNGNTMELSISETSAKTTATLQDGEFMDGSGQTWILREQSAPPASAAGVLQNEDVIKMVKAGFDDTVIIAKIGSSKCQFDTSTDALIQLKQSGVSAAVLNVMVGGGAALAVPQPAEIAAGGKKAEPEPPQVYKPRPLPSGQHFVIIDISVRKVVSLDRYTLEVSFIVPAGSATDRTTFVDVYESRTVAGARTFRPAGTFQKLTGSWKPGDRVTLPKLELPKEFADPAKGWDLRFCVGSTAGCYPSPNLLVQDKVDSALPPTAPGVPSQQELAVWNSIKDSADRSLFADYLQRFPNGSYRAIAEKRMTSLSEGDRTRAAASVDRGLRAGIEKENPKDGLKYVWIPPGRFLMGCSAGDTECKDDEKPAHEVTITKGFWMGQTEVTREAYQRVIGNNPRDLNGAKLPVGAVSWKEAQRYCQLIGGRLPTEAEWEYAARGGTPAARYGNLEDIAWYRDNSVSRAHEAGQKQPNAFGLYDMLGNVAEWVADWYADYQAGSQQDPGGPAGGQYRVARGGSWGFNLRGERASDRIKVGPEARYSDFGLRCATLADASLNPPAHLPAAAPSIQQEPRQDQLNETTADVNGVTGTLGVQSGLIATNPKELAALRLKGERNYTDVKLGKTKQPQRFGDIALRLDSVNPKQGRYTVEILADDKTLSKKEKSINEPVQFYAVKGGRTPYELVIYQINKDGIVGYLSTPRVTTDWTRVERIYQEVRLGPTKQPQRFGEFALMLHGADPERQTYSVGVIADDKMTLKQDKNVNELVQFYTIKGGRTPYNLIINQVTTDGIFGYLWSGPGGATDTKEREALRLRSQRNYTDIKLEMTGQPQRFGDIALKLASVDLKRNTYSVYVLADDKRIYKEDKAINEPVQFYTIKGGQIPYELVINQVTKDGVVGYLSTPKDTGTR
jgi:formylglycine-generating enzyme required for sulfatase activity